MMLLKLYELAKTQNLLELDELAFDQKVVHWLICLDADGQLIGQGPMAFHTEQKSGRARLGKEYLAPITPLNKSQGGIAEFLYEGMVGVLGLGAEEDAEDAEDNADSETESKSSKKSDKNSGQKKYEDFWRQIQNAFDKTKSLELSAMLKFHEAVGQNPPFLKQTGGDAKKPKFSITTLDGKVEKCESSHLFTFKVGDMILLNDEGLRAHWRQIYKVHVDEVREKSEKGICLITGKESPLARIHPIKIKRVPAAQATGASIVAFDKKSFRSYGFEQSINATCSIEAATGYCKALNFLMKNEDHHCRLGSETIICFWAKKDRQAGGFLKRKFLAPDPKTVKDFLKSPWAGLDRELLKFDEFYSTTLSGNGGRIVVRQWLQMNFEDAIGNLVAWFSDLEICDYGDPMIQDKAKVSPLALKELALTTVREEKDLRPEVLTQLYNAALQNTAPMLSLLSPILHRLAVDLSKPKDSSKSWQYPLYKKSRFALIRLILNRHQRNAQKMSETVHAPIIGPKVHETDDFAYNCGRLLALFDDLQAKAHDYKLEGASVVARYYGTASATPNSAFGILWRLHQHHLHKLERMGDKGRRNAAIMERRIAEIAALFPPSGPRQPPQFPRSFDLQAQGRFALGFYQQKAEDDSGRRQAKQNKPSEDTSDQAPDFNDPLP